ncbi:uncharacterized protein LTHEOB_5918 [Lasiodiplodia theobromae]|uniref:uncharacterized protein n=1 Tax=Lasiodiplodia theobromae TaxID=45133 RepID=UPI0015C31E25|nr:uncharacterized protein LTHEOB_5918 [Lasiodiplodia theobromae]KAF4544909.1 hypothetical protein LTHEOB_5918 [Lasiodiplodia theobromae]
MYRVSYREDGLLTITDKPYLDYGLRYIPVTTMLLFGLAIGVLDFEIKTFEPFHTLRRGPVPATLSINENYFGRVGFHALWTALRKRRWCTAATSVGMVLSPFLTIFASGLYYTDTAFDTQTLSLRQSEYFKLTSFTELHEISVQSDGVMTANLVLNDHMDLPDWTYATFAIPTLHHIVDPLPVRSDSFVRVTMPVVRPVANCTIVTPEAIWMEVSGGGAIHMLEMEVSTMSTCGDQQKWYDIHRNEVRLPLHDGFFGQWVDRSGLDYHCPEYMAIVGELDDAVNMTNLTQVNVLHCTPYLERVDATVSLTYPDLRTLRTTGDINITSFDTATAVIPVLNESVKQTLASVEILHLGDKILTPYATEDEMAPLGNVDGFFGTLIRNGASLSDFVSDSAALQRAVEDLYVRIVTQVVSVHRDTTPPSNATTQSVDLGRLWNATLYEPNRLRLHQSALSTHVLAALLSVMSICIATTFLMQTKEVLPKNPRSIAAVASLLAGSKLLERWPECRDEGFSMGYWRDESVGADQAEADGISYEGAEDETAEERAGSERAGSERAGSERADSETDGQETNVSELAESDHFDGDRAGDETAGTEQDSSEGMGNELSVDEAGNLNVDVTEEDDRGEEAAMMEAGKANLRFGIDIGTPDEI